MFSPGIIFILYMLMERDSSLFFLSTVIFDFLTALRKVCISIYSVKHFVSIILTIPEQDLSVQQLNYLPLYKLIKWMVMPSHNAILRPVLW
jgi:hypothetical protein